MWSEGATWALRRRFALLRPAVSSMTLPGDGSAGLRDDAKQSNERPEGSALRRIRVQTQFSSGFGDWLIRERVGLVASTYRTGHLLFIGVTAEVRRVPSAAGFSQAMGIAATSQWLYVGAKTNIWRMDNFLRDDELDSDLFDRVFVPRVSYVTGDINIREIAVEASGRLVFANAIFSCLVTLSKTRAFKPLWKPKFVARLAPEDRCHLNGPALADGRLRYVMYRSTGDSIESWRGPRQQRDGGHLGRCRKRRSDRRGPVDASFATGRWQCHLSHRVRAWGAGAGRPPIGAARGRRTVSWVRARTGVCARYAVLTISLPRSTSLEMFDLMQLLERAVLHSGSAVAHRCS